MLQFALVAAPFIALLLGTVETALVYFTQEALETAAEQASRRILTGGAQSAGTSKAAFKQAACADLPTYLTCSNLFVDVQTASSFSDADMAAPTLTFDSSGKVANSFTYDMGGAGSIVVLRLIYLWPVSTGPLALNLGNVGPHTRMLVATAVAKSEPYG